MPEFKITDRVYHNVHGYGDILEAAGSEARVYFDRDRVERRILTTMGNLRLVEAGEEGDRDDVAPPLPKPERDVPPEEIQRQPPVKPDLPPLPIPLPEVKPNPFKRYDEVKHDVNGLGTVMRVYYKRSDCVLVKFTNGYQGTFKPAELRLVKTFAHVAAASAGEVAAPESKKPLPPPKHPQTNDGVPFKTDDVVWSPIWGRGVVSAWWGTRRVMVAFDEYPTELPRVRPSALWMIDNPKRPPRWDNPPPPRGGPRVKTYPLATPVPKPTVVDVTDLQRSVAVVLEALQFEPTLCYIVVDGKLVEKKAYIVVDR